MICSFKNGLPYAEDGLGLDFNHYVSGRISADIVKHGGISRLYYIGKQGFRRAEIFSGSQESAFTKVGRLQFIIDEQYYYPEFRQTTHYPFGFRSKCELEGIRFQHELILDQNTLYQTLRVLDNPESRSIRARIVLHGNIFTLMPDREVENWILRPDGFLETFLHDPAGMIRLRSLCSVPCKIYSRNGPFKYYIETLESGDLFVFAFQFDSTERPAFEFAANRIDDWEKQFQKGIRFVTGNTMVDSALNNAVPTLKSLVVADRLGAIRASQSYWIWGWDSMIHAEALLWSGNSELVQAMLQFYRETADPVNGIAHCMGNSFQPDSCMCPCSQSLYIIMLTNYCAATGDIETGKKHYDFVQWLLDFSTQDRHPNCSLRMSVGFFPDFPELLEQRKCDISLINNSLYLQALKSAASLELALGMTVESRKHSQEADQLQKDMERILWDDSVGYWCDSADGKLLVPRSYYPLYGQLYASPFGNEPHAEEQNRIGDFLKKKFRFNQGLYMFPPDNAAFMADGNQLGAYYPSVDRYFWNIMNQIGDVNAVSYFQRIVEYYWSYHTYPEGLTRETVNIDPTIDNPGCKQAFSMKGWFCDAIELYLGLKVYMDGITLNPLKTKETFRVENLVLHGKKFTFELIPNGIVLLNGVPAPLGKITWKMMRAYDR